MKFDDELKAALGALLGHSDAIVVVATREGRVAFANRPGATLDDVFSSPSPRELALLLERVIASGQGETLEATHEGTTFQVSFSPVRSGDRVTAVLALGADVSGSKQREDRMKRSEALLVDAQGVAHLGTWEWDVGMPTLVWSDELYRIYAVTPQTYTPTYEGYLTKVHPEDRDRVRKATEAVFRDHLPFSHDERILRPDGSIRYLHTWAQAELGPDGQLQKLLGVCQDITDRKLAEAALVEARKHEAIGRLAAGIAHDFNNVLAVALANVGLVQAKLPADDPMQKNLEEIATAASQGARLTQQLLAVGRGSGGARESINLGKVATDLTEFLRRAAGALIEVEVYVGGTKPPRVLANRSEIEQIILNLVVNARDAMPKGGKLVIEVGDLTSERVPLPRELEGETDPVVLSVTDTGSGMDEGVVARVFDPYFSTKAQGHGLGLATVFGIVRKAGGAITVQSHVGVGTTFRVFLPRDDEKRASVQVPAAAAATAFSGSVLLVDDQDVLRRSLQKVLAELGFAVHEARGASEALAIVERREVHLDVLLTDIVMPVMNGVELVRRAKAVRPELDVVFMTGSADQGIVSQLDGKIPLLTKPFTTAELAQALRRALDAR